MEKGWFGPFATIANHETRNSTTESITFKCLFRRSNSRVGEDTVFSNSTEVLVMIYLTDVVIDINLCCRIKKGAKYETLKKIYEFKLNKHLMSNISIC